MRNSRYIDLDWLKGLMGAVGFVLIKQRWKEGGKVGYWLWAWQKGSDKQDVRWQKKELLQDGPKRNNFAVILP